MLLYKNYFMLFDVKTQKAIAQLFFESV